MTAEDTRLKIAAPVDTLPGPMDRTEPRRAIVVGASAGIGAALASRLARAGYHTALVARREGKLTRLCEEIESSGAPGVPRAYVHDVRSFGEVPALFQRIVEDLHGLDVILYVAGVMPEVGPEEFDLQKDRASVETNLIGAMAWLNEAARWLAVAGRGSIVGISSMAGERGRRAAPAYGASKAGLNTYLESLRNRLSVLGVHVLTVKPGFVRTAMLEGRSGAFWVTEPDAAAEQILRAIERQSREVFVSPRWRLVSWIVRAIPSFLFRRLGI
jgi:short-subunit dehydrogenase